MSPAKRIVVKTFLFVFFNVGGKKLFFFPSFLLIRYLANIQIVPSRSSSLLICSFIARLERTSFFPLLPPSSGRRISTQPRLVLRKKKVGESLFLFPLFLLLYPSFLTVPTQKVCRWPLFLFPLDRLRVRAPPPLPFYAS